MKLQYLVSFLLIWIIIIFLIPNGEGLLRQYWYFFFIGLIGAVVANSTGAGGGIIFVPFFTTLGLTETETLATSIIIQSFGMTAGAVGWLISIKNCTHHFTSDSYKLQKELLFIAGPASVIGVLCAQYLITSPPFHMIDLFQAFSIIFGSALLFITLIKRAQIHTRHSLNTIDHYLIIVTSFIGGLMTAWISIGIGEIVAILLIIRHFPIMIAVSTGVCLSSLSVLAAAPYHIELSNPVWGIILFAAPAAVIGGSIARFLSFRLGPVRLKIFFATWILATGISM